MSLYLRASKHVGNGFPSEEGKKLANALIKAASLGTDVTIDLRRLPARMLISTFFNEFYQHLLTENPELITDIIWDTDYDFQLDNINRWYADAIQNLNVAQRAAQRLRRMKNYLARRDSRQELSNFRDQCLDTATCKKNWPIWLAAFKDDQPMLQRIKEAMAKTDLDGLQDK